MTIVPLTGEPILGWAVVDASGARYPEHRARWVGMSPAKDRTVAGISSPRGDK